MEKIRTVIFGGSFDPIHVGHLSLASEVVASGLAGEVWFLVSPQNPHKEACRLSDENVRMQMVRLAIEGNEKFKASDFEFTLPRPSYTINTLSALEKAFPDRGTFFSFQRVDSQRVLIKKAYTPTGSP